MSNQLTLEELTAELSSTQTSTTEPAIPTITKQARPAARPAKAFLTRQFPLFSSPYFSIYLQSTKGFPLAALPPETTEAQLLSAAFACGTLRRVGKHSPVVIEAMAPHIKMAEFNLHKLYVDKIWHKAFLLDLIKAGAKLDINKVGNKAYPLEAINAYLNSLAEFLTDEGYDSPDDYLFRQVKSSNTKKLEADDLEAMWEAFNEGL